MIGRVAAALLRVARGWREGLSGRSGFLRPATVLFLITTFGVVTQPFLIAVLGPLSSAVWTARVAPSGTYPDAVMLAAGLTVLGTGVTLCAGAGWLTARLLPLPPHPGRTAGFTLDRIGSASDLGDSHRGSAAAATAVLAGLAVWTPLVVGASAAVPALLRSGVDPGTGVRWSWEVAWSGSGMPPTGSAFPESRSRPC